ncbi:MAG: orotate phosphoribosyltransferase [Actinomycetaceae bacterium]|nr:orotate phosphoribosyltransferase [Arcanobacterium sp.]MDD7504559.1 orotate phosphoribosyltransferase [Actinomycetaceae bacterium]MDY6143202.1 orotate phosphoribosyltransferase [Arcanobacterium sp.]
MNTKERIARDLLAIKAVFLRPEEPFTWASGIKSPIYCDNRLTLGYPEVRTRIEEGFAELIRAEFPEAESLMGTATAGIAHAAITAQLLSLPMGYVRSGAKDHGRNNRIEGVLNPGTKVVVVEDLVSTGGSVIEVVDALRDAGAHVLGVVSIFTYGMEKATQRFEQAHVRYLALTDFDEVVRVAVETGAISPDAQAKLLAFRANPQDESWMN